MIFVSSKPTVWDGDCFRFAFIASIRYSSSEPTVWDGVGK